MTTKSWVDRFDGPGMRFTVRNGSGREVVLDDAEGNAGPRPVEMRLSVAAILSAGTVEIRRRDRLLAGAAAIEGEVMVTGPHADPDALREPRLIGATG